MQLRAVLISVTVLLVVLPVLIFLVGFFSGGYYFSQRWRKSTSVAENEPPPNPTTEAQEGVTVDVKKNVAYNYVDLDPE